MVDLKRGDLDAALLVHHALLELGDFWPHVFWHQVLVGGAGADVPVVGLDQALHQLARAGRAVDAKRPFALRVRHVQPARQPEVGNAHDVVGMQVRDEQTVELPEPHAGLQQALRHAAPAVDQELLAAGFHQYAGPKAAHHRRWAAGAQQRDAELVSGHGVGHELGVGRQALQSRQRRAGDTADEAAPQHSAAQVPGANFGPRRVHRHLNSPLRPSPSPPWPTSGSRSSGSS